jgi:xanthine dehydrogenase molybdopterin-binding subunit B
MLRSDRPHAKILAIQTGQAERHPGVVAVFTSRDIPGTNRIGGEKKDQPVLTAVAVAVSLPVGFEECLFEKPSFFGA